MDQHSILPFIESDEHLIQELGRSLYRTVEADELDALPLRIYLAIHAYIRHDEKFKDESLQKKNEFAVEYTFAKLKEMGIEAQYTGIHSTDHLIN